MNPELAKVLKWLWNALLQPRGIIYLKISCVSAMTAGSFLDWLPTIHVRWSEGFDVGPAADSIGTVAVLAGMTIILVAMNLFSNRLDQQQANGLQSLFDDRQIRMKVDADIVCNNAPVKASFDVVLQQDLLVKRPLKLKGK